MRYFNRLREFLNSQPFASEIEVQGLMDSAITGNFEVAIVETKQLIHSSKRGMGHQMSVDQMNAIAIHIEDTLEEEL